MKSFEITKLNKAFGLLVCLSVGLAACGQKSEDKSQEAADATEKAQPAEAVENTEAQLAEYKDENLAYLETNKANEGWTVTDSGLQYKIVTEGSGAVPVADDLVVVHYAGRLIDGTEFDSSYKRGEPATFPAGRLIKGWVEALLMMPAGSKWELVIPADLAYGDQDRGPIPANSTLIFEVELQRVTSEEELIAEMRAPQDDYLATNSARSDVTTTESGLQYKVIESGEGATPADTDSVTVHYAGRLIDGTEFDSSYKRGEPATFPVNGVIAGWTEALQLMKEGDKWELTIPSDLGYGPRGTGGIPPFATLVFDVELIKVN